MQGTAQVHKLDFAHDLFSIILNFLVGVRIAHR